MRGLFPAPSAHDSQIKPLVQGEPRFFQGAGEDTGVVRPVPFPSNRGSH